MFEHCLYFNTASLARRLEREWAKAFKPFGLTPAQAFMLRVVLEKSPISLTALASALNIAKATGSRSADGLENSGFIKRLQTDEDGRGCDIVPTRAAREIQAELNLASAEVTKRIKRAIGDEEFETVVSRLRAISSAIE